VVLYLICRLLPSFSRGKGCVWCESKKTTCSKLMDCCRKLFTDCWLNIDGTEVKISLVSADREAKVWDVYTVYNYPGQNHRITESQNGRGWKGPLWVI